MDPPAPQSYFHGPILSYVLSRLPTLPKPTAAAPDDDAVEFDIEQPPMRSPTPTPPRRLPMDSSAGDFELVERGQGRRDHPVARAVNDVSDARCALQALAPRPDHEHVDSCRARIAAAAAAFAEGDRIPGEEDLEKWRAAVSLEEAHEKLEAQLREAEARLERVNRSVMQGKDLEEVAAAEGNDESSSAVVGAGAEAGGDDAAVQEEAIAVLKRAEEGKAVESVRLVHRRLRHLPEAFGRIQGLRVLDVSRNQLEVIPDAIGGLDHLEELCLAFNDLVSLPDSIGLLYNLKVFNVSTNKLRALPDSISKCRSLVEIDASYNMLTHLPTNFGLELVNLQKLWVHMNKLRCLPSSISHMRSLYLLDAHFNELCGLPTTIGNLHSLQILNLSSNFNDMKELPSSFGDLMNLCELDLNHNQIHALPESFGRLKKLEKLSLEQNPLTMPSTEIVSKGVYAIKEHMLNRWEEKQRIIAEARLQASTPTAWLARGVSWVLDISWNFKGYLFGYGAQLEGDPYINQKF